MILTIYGADLAGDCWDQRETYTDPREALTALETLRHTRPQIVWGVYDSDDPERGDIELELEEAVEEMPRMNLGVPL